MNATSGDIRLDSICGLGWRFIESIPVTVALDQNELNPFNTTIDISFLIRLDGPARLEILAMSGGKVARLVDEPLGIIHYRIQWNAKGYQSGVYYSRLQAVSWSRSLFIVLVK